MQIFSISTRYTEDRSLVTSNMAYVYHSQSETQQRAAFWGMKNVWVKRGDCRWIPASEDKNKEGKRYILNGNKVRIGECSWEHVPMSSVPLEDKEKLWQNSRQHVRPQVADPEFERRLNSLPPRLHLHPILETIASHLEEVIFFFFFLTIITRFVMRVCFLTA